MRLPTGLELDSYPLSKLLLSQEAPALNCLRFCFSLSILLETPNRVGVGQLSPIKAVIVTRSSCAEQSQVFVSPRRNFLRLPTAVDLGSYPLFKLLLSQEAPARSIRRFLYLLVNTSSDSNRCGVGQLSPIRNVIVTRSSCAEQSQVFVSPRRNFLRLPTAVDLGSYPLFKLLLSQEAPARSSRRFLYLLVNTSSDSNRGGVGQLHQNLTLAGQALLLCRPLFICFEIDIWAS